MWDRNVWEKEEEKKKIWIGRKKVWLEREYERENKIRQGNEYWGREWKKVCRKKMEKKDDKMKEENEKEKIVRREKWRIWKKWNQWGLKEKVFSNFGVVFRKEKKIKDKKK